MTETTKPVISAFYGISSPWAYLGFRNLQAIARKHDAHIDLRPIRVITENGGVLLRSRPDARQRYHEVELDRWRKHLGIDLNLRPRYYPCRTIELAAKCVIALQTAGYDAQEVSFRIQRGLWAENIDIADLDTLKRIVEDVLGSGAVKLVSDPYPEDITAQWQANLHEAETLGIFGTPTYVIEGELFWGQDRLDFVDRKLAAIRVAAA